MWPGKYVVTLTHICQLLVNLFKKAGVYSTIYSMKSTYLKYEIVWKQDEKFTKYNLHFGLYNGVPSVDVNLCNG